MRTNMKVAYVGDIVNHGTNLTTIGTSIVLLLSMDEHISQVDVFCPKANVTKGSFDFSDKIKIYPSYEYDNLISLINLLKINKLDYDFIIFNLLPTGFGKSSFSNIIAMSIPIILSSINKKKRVRVVYHNSVFLNDFKKLGYKSLYNRLRSYFLKKLERALYKRVETFFLLEYYSHQIRSTVKNSKVGNVLGNFLEGVPSAYYNNVMYNTIYHKIERTPTILMHGNWGPQKDLELGLQSLLNLYKSNAKFKLIISGGINPHFQKYAKDFALLLEKYKEISPTYVGYVDEGEIFKIFLNSDLVLLPYKVSGGHSGVLEQAKYYGVPTIVLDFPEYIEEANNFEIVTVTSRENFSKVILTVFSRLSSSRICSLKEKTEEAIKNVSVLIS